jgi:hypothetical protein
LLQKEMTSYNQEIEEKMVLHYSQLREKEKRHYAAIEAIKLGYGGQKYISDLFELSPYRIRIGIQELNDPTLLSDIPEGKQRREGGGRKKKRTVVQP